MVEEKTQDLPKGPRYLPGDRVKPVSIEAMIRVNQAGEYGAKRIYQGQIDVLGNGPNGDIIRHMQDQEQVHLDYFSNEISKRGVRPTVLLPVWHVMGWVVGALPSLLGDKAAMACTVAVEETIDKHYQEQVATLGDDEKELRETIERFRLEELEHRDIGYDHDAQHALGHGVIDKAVRQGSKIAIWISQRF